MNLFEDIDQKNNNKKLSIDNNGNLGTNISEIERWVNQYKIIAQKILMEESLEYFEKEALYHLLISETNKMSKNPAMYLPKRQAHRPNLRTSIKVQRKIAILLKIGVAKSLKEARKMVAKELGMSLEAVDKQSRNMDLSSCNGNK